ncbi:hypothetical protein BLNAU_15068 [Blattamonas nauphoetae]|uniref:Guanine nucleotide-binding protein-like 3 N-terminal domain-containing protein n=1 Tax=Blattamonas nauphoetae TaxID=2049346 RepID=A0ABQ9XBY9_9EUKA|nr:hypothetical protein BLNAU_15068 [Blattamonas nauphoetae]
MPPKEHKKAAKKAKKPSTKTKRYIDYPRWKIKKFQSLQRRRDAGKKKKKVELFGPGAVKGPKAKELYQKRLERDKEAFEKRQSKRQERMRAEYLISHPNLKPDDVAGKLFHKEKRPHRIFPHVQAKRAKVFECAMILDLYSTSEIVIEVLDARDPVATRCPLLESEATNNGKKLIRILNKADLVPQSLVELWIQYFSTIDSHPTLPLRSGSRRPLIDQALDPFGRDSVSNHPNPKDGFPEYNQLWSKPMNIPIPRRKRLLEAKDMSRHVQNEENYIGFDAVRETVIKLGLEYEKEHQDLGRPVRAGVFGYAGTGRRTLLTYFVTKHEEEIGPKPDPPKWDVKERKIVPLPPQTAPKNTQFRKKLEKNEYTRKIGHVLYDETLHEKALELGVTSPDEVVDQPDHPVVYHKTIPFHEKVVLCIAPSTIHEVKDPLSMRGLSTEHTSFATTKSFIAHQVTLALYSSISMVLDD